MCLLLIPKAIQRRISADINPPVGDHRSGDGPLVVELVAGNDLPIQPRRQDADHAVVIDEIDLAVAGRG